MIPWKEAKAEMLEIQAETVDSAIFGLERLEGLFGDRELGDSISTTINLLAVEAQNLRKQAEKNKSERPFVQEVH